MSEVTVAPTTETPSAASPTTAPATTEVAASVETPAVAAAEGTIEGEAPAEPEKEAGPDPKKLAKWSQKLERRTAKLDADRADFERQKVEQAGQVELAKAFDSKKIRPLIDAYAKRHNLSFEQAFNTLTHEAVNPDVPTVDQVVDARLAERDANQRKLLEERQANQQQEQIQNFAQQTHQYIAATLEQSPNEYLKAFNPQLLTRVAVDTILDGLRNGRGEVPLDKVLADMNAAEKARVELHLNRLRPGDPQIQANSERENGAGQPAKHEARKRGSSPTLNNSHAAQAATAPSAEDDLSDRALTKKAVDALRALPGWH